MPTSYDLVLSIDGLPDLRMQDMGMRANALLPGPLSVDVRIDIAARLKHIVIGELTQRHDVKSWTDKADVLPGHLALHRIHVMAVRHTSSTNVDVAVRLHVLSDLVTRKQLIEQRLNALSKNATKLPRSKSAMAISHWAVRKFKSWAELLGLGDVSNTPFNNGGSVEMTVLSPALRRCGNVWKEPSVWSLLDSASWNLRRMAKAGDDMYGLRGVELPEEPGSARALLESDGPQPVLVNATSSASAATKKPETRVDGLVGVCRLALPNDPSRQAQAMIWLRAFAWTGLGLGGTTGCGYVELRKPEHCWSSAGALSDNL